MMRYLILLALLASACGSAAVPIAPTPITPACQANNTAELFLSNQSTTSTTFDVLIDGVKRGTLSPAQTSSAYTVAASVAHTVESRITNSTIIACSSSPIFAQCSTQTLICRS